MADVNPAVFAATLARLGAPAPWRLDADTIDEVRDARGGTVLQLDPMGISGRTAPQLYQLALWLIFAVNTCAGVSAEPPKAESGGQ